MNFPTMTKALVGQILMKWSYYEWSLQGFGMLRTYLDADETIRLHVWDERYAVEGVSDMHTHPWDFVSYVVAGEVINTRFCHAADAYIENGIYEEFMEQKLRCGVGGGVVDKPIPTKMTALEPERYTEGNWYTQKAEEIHISKPASGTVTIVSRSFKEDTEHAYVYWPVGEEWVSAEPREAQPYEVLDIVEYSTGRWF